MRPFHRKLALGSLMLAIAMVAVCLTIPGATYIILPIVLTPIFFAAAVLQRP